MCTNKSMSFPLSTNYKVSSCITYLAILYIKQSKSLVPSLCRATEQLLSVILNVSKYLTHTQIFLLNTTLYLLLTCRTTHCTETPNCTQRL